MSYFSGHIFLKKEEVQDKTPKELERLLKFKLAPFDENTLDTDYMDIAEYDPSVLVKNYSGFESHDLRLSSYPKDLLDSNNLEVLHESEYNEGKFTCLHMISRNAIVVSEEGLIIKVLEKYVKEPKYDYFMIGGHFLDSKWALPLIGPKDSVEASFHKMARELHSRMTPISMELNLRSVCGRVGNIDWDKMKEYSLRENNFLWDSVEAVIDTQDIPYISDFETLDQYKKHPLIVKLYESDLDTPHKGWAEDFQGCNRQVSNENTIKRVLSPAFCAIKDGRWYERASMGWWGMTSGDKTLDEWVDIYQNLLNSSDPEDYIVLLHFHI